MQPLNLTVTRSNENMVSDISERELHDFTELVATPDIIPAGTPVKYIAEVQKETRFYQVIDYFADHEHLPGAIMMLVMVIACYIAARLHV